ncbi:MAG: conjugal transfer protein TraN, partial [Thiobacillus sp.]
DMMTSMGASLVKSFGTESIQYLGSTAVYDSLFQSDAPNFLINGMESILGGSGSSSVFSPSFSYFGLTVGYGAPAAGTTVLLGESGTFFVGFDPASFAIAIAIYIIMELVSCEQEEQILGMKRGQNLCVHVGTYCSQKVLGVCVQKKQSHCCFNSRIARLIAASGRSQLGKSWGSPQSPDCGGLTPAELQSIDFSLIDFSSVVADVKASVKIPDYAIDRATTKINSYYATP